MHTAHGITVAIDGPAGAGKSTVAKKVAEHLGYTLVDTGAIYRAVALLALRGGVASDDDPELERIVDGLRITFRFENGINHVYLDGEDVSDAIRAPEVSMAASAVSARAGVRRGLLQLQRRLAGAGGAVLEGRDIGTVVFPEAPVKVFLDASPQERARRRYAELIERGEAADLDVVLREMRERDAQDASRDVAPLQAAADAIVLDSTSMTIDAVVDRVVEAVRAAST